MCLDLSHLNHYVRQKRYQSPTPAGAVADITASNAKLFTVLDAMKSYHQCPLEQESQLLTTLINRFKYLCAPYGLSCISEHYNRHMAEAFADLTGFYRIMDDIVICQSDITEHTNYRTREIFGGGKHWQIWQIHGKLPNY